MNCPKCGAHISPLNLKPNCKNCGVNILLYSQEYSLERDAKRTELEFASARIILAKVKAAFIGGLVPIFRLVTTLLCVAALVIPFADVKLSTPIFGTDISLGGIGIYNLFSNGFLMELLNFAGSTLFGEVSKYLLASIGVLLLLALVEVALVLAELLSFINIKKSSKAMGVISIIGIAFCVVFVVSAFLLKGAVGASAFFSFSFGFGAPVAVLMLAVNAVLNFKIHKNDIPLKLREYDVERKETLKRIKRGELDFDDLTLPVFETQEEYEARIKELESILETEEEVS